MIGGKCYIGQTTNEKIRREHWNTIGSYAGVKIDRARVKLGLYDSYKNGYNCTIGGNTTLVGKKRSNDIKKKLSNIRRGRKFMCTIYKYLSGDNKTAGGFIWKYKED